MNNLQIMQLLQSSDENQRKQALSYLYKNPSPDNIAVIKKIAEGDPSNDIRFLAKKAINFLNKSSVAPPKPQQIKSQNIQKIAKYLSGSENEKISAINHIVGKNLTEASDLLVQLLPKEQNLNVLATAVLAIGKLNNTKANKLITKFLDAPDPRLRASAIEAIGLLEAKEGFAKVAQLINDPNNRARANAIIIAKKFSLVDTTQAIDQMVNSDSIAMKASAAYALKFFPELGNLKILIQLYNETDPGIKSIALSAIKQYSDSSIAQAAEFLAKLDSSSANAQEIDSEQSFSNSLNNISNSQNKKNAQNQPPKNTEAPHSQSSEILPKNYIDSPGHGSLAQELKLYAKQNPPDPAPGNSLFQILVWARTVQASDIHITPGSPLIYRQYTFLKTLVTQPFSKTDIEKMTYESPLDKAKIKIFSDTGDLEMVIPISGNGRFRVTFMRHLNGINITARIIPLNIRTFEETGMPFSCKDLINWNQGLVLVTGPTGSGKTSTLSTFIDMINSTRKEHIVTIEQPIEIYIEQKMAQISQREIGRHTLSQSAALRGALREDPDIIVVSELRDLDTMQLAISAAETGHLVFGTMNTINSTRAISRITDSFPPEDQAMLQNMISESLKGIISQQLVPRKDGTGVVPAYEVLIVTQAISNMIRKEGIHQLASAITLGKSSGMISMEQSLLNLVESGTISGEEAYARSENKSEFKKFLK